MSALLQEAIALHQRGAVAEAALRYARVLKREPNNVDALFYSGLAHCQQGGFADAVPALQKVTKLAPRHAPSRLLLGEALSALGRHDEALASFDQALALKPDLAEAHAYRGNALAALGRDAEAIASFDKALALRGDIAAIHVNRGNSLRKIERIDEALASYERALALQGDLAEAHISRGLALAELSRCAEAVESYDRALALAPPSPASDGIAAIVHSHRAWAANHVGHFDEAFASLSRALALAPDHDGIRFQSSFVELLHGRWREAWQHHESKSRYQSGLMAEFVARGLPRWNGEALTDELLVLVTEQGLGDAIHFSMFATALAARGIRVAICTLPVLAPLLSGVHGVERVVTAFGELGTEKIRWLPLMSVPALLGVMPDTVPQVAPYLTVDPARVAAWRDRLRPDGFKIGLAWQGSYKNINDRNRSIALARWAPLAAIPGARLISLQRGDGAEQVGSVEFRSRIETSIDPGDMSADALVDTAALTQSLDLVVTIDSMLAHLAGAIGRPVIVALRYVPEWRWLLGRDDSPWYPTMRLVRQTKDGDWDDVLRRVADAARAMQA